jgi:hypothetical protein
MIPGVQPDFRLGSVPDLDESPRLRGCTVYNCAYGWRSLLAPTRPGSGVDVLVIL